MATANKLGRNQKGVLGAMSSPSLHRPKGLWHPRIGWNWSGLGLTIKILQTLRDRGLVEHDRETAKETGQPLAVCFKITSEGEALVTQLKAEGDLR